MRLVGWEAKGQAKPGRTCARPKTLSQPSDTQSRFLVPSLGQGPWETGNFSHGSRHCLYK